MSCGHKIRPHPTWKQQRRHGIVWCQIKHNLQFRYDTALAEILKSKQKPNYTQRRNADNKFDFRQHSANKSKHEKPTYVPPPHKTRLPAALISPNSSSVLRHHPSRCRSTCAWTRHSHAIGVAILPTVPRYRHKPTCIHKHIHHTLIYEYMNHSISLCTNYRAQKAVQFIADGTEDRRFVNNTWKRRYFTVSFFCKSFSKASNEFPLNRASSPSSVQPVNE